ncbi:hypothetical protein M3J07_000156 [Ascochyta lentis]
MDGNKHDQLEQRDAALQQSDQLRTQQQPHDSYQPQQLSNLQPQYPQYACLEPAAQRSFRTVQTPQRYMEALPYVNAYGNESDQQTGYRIPQPATSSLPPWPAPNYYYPPFVMGQWQMSFTSWPHGYPLNESQGGGAHGYWQAQQAQPQYTWQGYQIGWPGQQMNSNLTQDNSAVHNSYLSSAGVPFDLNSNNSQVQVAHKPTESHNNYQPTYTGPRSGLHKAFYGAYEPLTKEYDISDRPPYAKQKAAADPASKNRPSYSNVIDVDERSKTALVRYSPEPSIPRARPYRGRREDEYLQWDEQYGFGFAVSPPKDHPLRATRSRPAVDRGKYVSNHSGERRSEHISPTSSLFSARGHGEHSQQQDKSPREGRGRASERSWEPAILTVYDGSPSRQSVLPKAMQLFEHSVNSDGVLQTTIQEVHSGPTSRAHSSRNTSVPGYYTRILDKETLGSHKQHVPMSHLKELCEGIQLPADEQKAFDADCFRKDGRQATQTSLEKNNLGEEHVSLDHIPSIHVFSDLKEEPTQFPGQATSRPSKPRVHRRIMTNSTSPSPPSKRTKSDSTSSLDRSKAQPNPATEPAAASPRTTGGWSNFAAHIAQDDKQMAVRAHEDLQRLGGETFRPEFRETYRDQQGKKETTVHDQVGGSASALPIREPQDTTAAKKKEERQTSGGDVVVHDAYDTDSEDGGIALSPSDGESDSAVLIKTGDEGQGWKRG